LPGSGKESQTLAGHRYGVNAVAVTPDGKRAVSASDDQTLQVWDLATGKVVATFYGRRRLLSYPVGPDGRVIVVGDVSGRVHFPSLEVKDDNWRPSQHPCCFSAEFGIRNEKSPSRPLGATWPKGLTGELGSGTRQQSFRPA
jgi:WD40 repeat protein